MLIAVKEISCLRCLELNATEEKILEAAKLCGWKVIRGGFPDFLLVSPRNKRYGFFVEVKSGSSPLNKAQKRTFDALRQLGFEVIVSYDGEWIDPEARRMVTDIDDFRNYVSRLKTEVISYKEKLGKLDAEIKHELFKLSEKWEKDVKMNITNAYHKVGLLQYQINQIDKVAESVLKRAKESVDKMEKTAKAI